MNKLILFYLLIFVSNSIAQTNIKTFVIDSTYEIKSCNPNTTDINELTIIKNSIGDARVVMMGEQDHGDAPTFLAKTKLIKYLHENMGFNVLVFESDFWSLHEAWKSVNTTFYTDSTIKKNTYACWRKSAEMQYLYEYIDSCSHTENPLIITGMDCRHALNITLERYYIEFKNNILNPFYSDSTNQEYQRFCKILKELITKEYQSKISENDQLFFLLKIEDFINKNSLFSDYWKQELYNLKGGAINSWDFKNRSIRDEQMAHNLSWIVNKEYPKEKIIVWAHNGHIAKNMDIIKDQNSMDNTKTAGNYFIDNNPNINTYLIGFTSLQGRAGALGIHEYKVKTIKGENFENWINSKNIAFGFINLQNLKINTPFFMNGIEHRASTASWNKIYDGVFYIRDMYSSHVVY